MTLPPERITVKRRRDDEPIEALYAHSKKHRPSGVWRLACKVNDQFISSRPTASSTFPQQPQIPTFDSPKVPVVRTTLPNRDVPCQHRDVLSEAKPNIPSALTQPIRRAQQLQESAIGPRRFHLTRSSLKLSSPYATSETSAQRHAKSTRNELVVFVEAGKTFRDKPRPSGEVRNRERTTQIHGGTNKDVANSDNLRKRTSATAVERKWRSRNWGKPTEPKTSTEQHHKSACNVNQPSYEWDYESPELAAQLQNIAFQETRAPEEHLKSHQSGQSLKVKPEPPKPRRPTSGMKTIENEDTDEVMAETILVDEEGDYVFDTYVRSIVPPRSTIDTTGALVDPLHGIKASNMGILIIEDGEEEALWEAFGDEGNSDLECNSEEEDENAEDFYGNDYPEDEVDSDDEFDKAPYSYRHGASDDEQFGDEEPSWSDDEKSSYRS